MNQLIEWFMEVNGRWRLLIGVGFLGITAFVHFYFQQQGVSILRTVAVAYTFGGILAFSSLFGDF